MYLIIKLIINKRASVNTVDTGQDFFTHLRALGIT